MFILSKIKDLVRIPPDQFFRDTLSAVTHQLNTRYANRVVPHLGLCVAVYDILEVDEGQLRPGDGSAYIYATFRVVLFKPFVGEIITGWISQCTAEGIKVSLLGLFDDIFIPQKMLFEGCYFSPDELAWIWPMDEETKLYFDVNERIRFRVEQEVFVDVKPKSPKEREAEAEAEAEAKAKAEAEAGAANGSGGGTTQGDQVMGSSSSTKVERPPAYAILGSCQTDGMGLVSWWE